MKKFLCLVMLLTVFILSCSKGDDVVKLEKGTPVYEFAKELSAKLPSLDPDKNIVLVSAKDFKITTGELMQSMYNRYGKRINQLKEMQADQLKSILEHSLKNIAEKNLFLNAANKVNTNVTTANIDSVLNLQYQRAGGEAKFVEFIKSIDKTLDDVKDDIRTTLIINTYLDGILDKEIQVSEEDIKKAFQEDKTATVRHILLMTQGKSDSDKKEIRKKMEDILAQAKKGADFAELAKKYTEDPGSKDKGGLYENFERGAMVKPFEDAAFSVPIGEISDIVETRYGYHILKVIERKKETRPFEQARKDIEKKFKSQKKKGVYETHIAKLKEEADFEETGL